MRVEITDGVIPAAEIVAGIKAGSDGAVCVFDGIVRDNSRGRKTLHLDYEAYREMAGERIAAIARDCVHRHEVCALAAEHRLGAVALGEPSVIVAVSAPHRDEAFAAAREAIDRIKSEAPIWKVEVDAAGARSRVDGTPAPGARVAGEQADETSMARGSA